MSQRYDVIVIGAGLGGLTTAALLARNGAKVLLLEQHYVVGGCASTFRRGPYLFDVSVHLMGGMEEGGSGHKILQELDVLDRLPLVEVSPMYRVQIGNDSYDIPANLDEFAAALVGWFPDEAVAIKETMSEIRDFGNAILDSEKLTPNLLHRLPEFHRKPVDQYLAGRFRNPRIRFLITSLFPYIGATPDELETLFFMGVLASYHGGAFYTEGSSQKLADALSYAITRDGGEVKLRTRVDKILIEDGRVTGVRTKKGEEYRATTVVTNADMKTTFSTLVASENLPAGLAGEIQRMRSSHSAILLYAGIRNDGWESQLPHEMIVYPQENFHKDNNGFNPLHPELGGWFIVTRPTSTDPRLAPEGKSIVAFQIGCDAELVEVVREERGKEFVTEAALQMLETHLPGLRERIEQLEVATPRTVRRYTGNTNGAVYGWKKSYNQPWSKSAAGPTAISGLYAAGHWTNSGHGVYGAMRSARQTAQAIIEAWKQS
ncbi:phytoene desaturase family protein [Tumebacillus permanentifrigoris]|uniref:Prolycopene isomerase n=1 Tax=Tumebacillus permanentifrigoris TaxID=378543 RepID=A0A316DDL4_9BACL|nr:NAD(P)/FAD-dependent oxidoreductase [Tumebacillus permanentifrigoris]PWK15786.1 prolycopene isomerase [Tumebacillus permanentifrigoris]